MRAIFQALPDVFFLVDASGVIRRCKGGRGDDLMMHHEELVGRRIQDVPSPVAAEAFETALARIAAHGEPEAFEYALTTGGAEQHFEARMIPLGDGQVVVVVRNITERRRADAAMREIRNRFELVARATNDAVWDYDVAADRVWWGAGVETLFGYSRDRIDPSAAFWLDRVHDDDRDAVRASFHEFLSGALASWSAEYRFRKADGGFADVFDRGYAERDAAGRAVRAVGTMLDITDRKRTEHRLRRLVEFEEIITLISAHLINLPPERSDAGILDALRLVGEFAEVDRCNVSLYSDDGAQFAITHEWHREGLEPDAGECSAVPGSRPPWAAPDLRGRDVDHIPDVGALPQEAAAAWGFCPLPVAPEGRAPCLQDGATAGQTFCRHRGARSLLLVPLRYGGQSIGCLAFVSIRARRTWDDEEIARARTLGEVLVGALERKKADVRIREQAALLAVARDAIVLTDLGGRVRYWNPGAERLYGRTSAEAVGREFHELVQREDAEGERRANDALLARGEWTGEIAQRTGDGRRVVVESRRTLVRDAAGAATAILGVNTDVTDRAQAQRHALRAQRMESIGTLAGGIAHDLNNLLTPIMLAIRLLRDRHPGETDARLLASLDKNAARAADMVSRLLMFARGVEGERTTVSAAQLVGEIEKLARETFPRSIRVQIDVAGGAWTVHGDATQLHQVLLNLCLNARDAMRDGGTLTIVADNVRADVELCRSHPDARPGPYLVLTVADTGCGIAPDLIDKIFEPFFTTKDVGEGTGLGLSTTLAIVRSHGGFVTVASELGAGTRFSVYLPAALGDAKDVAAADPPSAVARGGGELLLVVDDEADILSTTTAVLEDAGYQVVSATDGAQAMGVFARRSREISLVVTDVMMPIMDGAALARALHTVDPGVRIVAVSGFMNAGRGVKVGESGVRAVLNKPYRAEALLAAVRSALRSPEPGSAVRPA